LRFSGKKFSLKFCSEIGSQPFAKNTLCPSHILRGLLKNTAFYTANPTDTPRGPGARPKPPREDSDGGVATTSRYDLAQALRLEPNRVDPLVMRHLQRCCSNCDSKQLCVHELEDKPKGATWPKYCPNEQTIKALMDHAQAG
jgi:Family of unknown function (DUF6455)